MNSRLLREIAEKYGTPCYVFDLDAFSDRIRHIKYILGERVRLYYAVKANPFLTRAAAAAADGLEVCSPGEYAICRRAKIPAERIVLSGVNKEQADVERVVREQGAYTYTAESLNQRNHLEAGAADAGAGPIRVLLRVTSGNQFGMDEAAVMSAIRERRKYPHVTLAGLQYYSGTQKKKADKIYQELLRMDSLCTRIRQEEGFELQELEYGPGFQIPYFEGEALPDEEALWTDLKKVLDSLAFRGTIILEMGRFLAAPCGSYVTRVADVKNNCGQNYCIVDGGINHVNYYGQAMAMKVPPYRYLPMGPGNPDLQAELRREAHGSKSEAAQAKRWTVCGSLCTSGDVLVKNLPLPGLKAGDLLIFDRIGAYSVTEGIYLFLSRRLPRILTYTEKDGVKLIREAIPTDLLNDPGKPAWLPGT